MIYLLAWLITVAIWGLIFWLLFWGLGKMGLPEPFQKVAFVVLVIASVIVAIGLITGEMGVFPIVNKLMN